MGSFEDFMVLEMSKRRALLQASEIGYDDDPNNPVAPDVLKLAPVGVWYLRETPVQVYEKLTAGTNTWTEAGAGGGGGMVTEEPLAIPIDYDEGGGGSVGDPPAGTVFRAQADVDQVLTDNSWTAFKHLQAVWGAIPLHKLHDIIFNCAAGVHRPAVATGTACWYLDGRTVSSKITINGALPSTWPGWDPTLEDLVVDSFDATPGDPYLDFSVTNPGVIAGFGIEMEGKFVVTDAGQVMNIKRQVGDRLFVSEPPTPTPATATIAIPSTMLRNSLDDVNKFTNYGLVLSHLGVSPPTFPAEIGVAVNDLTIQTVQRVSIGSGVTSQTNLGIFDCNRPVLRNIYSDHRSFGIPTDTVSGTGVVVERSIGVIAWGFTIASTPGPASTWQDPLVAVNVTDNSRVTFYATYINGFRRPIKVQDSRLAFGASTLFSLGGRYSDSNGNIQVLGNAGRLVFWDFSTFWSHNDIRFIDWPSPNYAIVLRDGARLGGQEEGTTTDIRFEDILQAGYGCIELGDQAMMFLWSGGAGLTRVANITAPPIRFGGSYGIITVLDNTDLASDTGVAVLMRDGTELTWAEIQTLGPFIDSYGNRVEKA